MPIGWTTFKDLVDEVRERHIATGAPLTQLVGEALARVGVTDPGVKLKLLEEVSRVVPAWKHVKRGLVEERRGRGGRIYRAADGFQPDRDD